MPRITAYYQLQFGGAEEAAEEASGGMEIELDSRAAGYNDGKEKFVPADNPVFLIYHHGVAITQLISTHGALEAVGPELELIDIPEPERFTVAGAESVTLSHFPVSVITWAWLGLAPDVVVVPTGRVLEFISAGEPAEAVGLLETSYTTAASAYRLTGVPAGTKEVLVYAQGEAV